MGAEADSIAAVPAGNAYDDHGRPDRSSGVTGP